MASGSHRSAAASSKTTTKVSSTKARPSSGSPASHRRSGSGSAHSKGDSGVSGRVRVAVRVRPRNAEELAADADFADCVELQPEIKRLKLRKNNWDSDTYEFDEVLTEFASQKRVYEVVAKPVVESVLEGYNGTVMAYGQTGTGKTFTLGNLGEKDPAARGIMVRALEDIFADITSGTDSVSVSYLQLYMETIQDLLLPGNDNISIVEDPKTGDISVPGATLVEIRDQKSFIDLLRSAEVHRFSANTKLNTESSRSHAILMVFVRRSLRGRHDREPLSFENEDISSLVRSFEVPIVRKSKLVIVDLAGSERINKSGSEGHTLEEAKSINLSLTSLGKCINATAENSVHVPFRDSKLTRLLRDSFGGTARTSLVITIGPSPRHRGETASTVMFGQRAMKVQNMLKLKEEFDYKSLSRRLEMELDKVIVENERQKKNFKDEIERIRSDAHQSVAESEKNFRNNLEIERLKCQKDYMESIKRFEEQWIKSHQDLGSSQSKLESKEGEKEVNLNSCAQELSELKELLGKEINCRRSAEEEVKKLKSKLDIWKNSEAAVNVEIINLHKMLEEEAYRKEKLEKEIGILKGQLLKLSFEADESRKSLDRCGNMELFPASESPFHPLSKISFSNLFEQVGLQKIFSLLESADVVVRIHAVKVVANLAAEEANQERIVEAGGLSSLLTLLKTSKDETIRRVAAGAIANLAMNELIQELIVAQDGIDLLSLTASEAEDPQTLRMVAGAMANLCGNEKLQMKLKNEGGIRALLGMVRCGHPDVLSQIARGIANFAKCESRISSQGKKIGRSLLIEDRALPWIVNNANSDILPIRRHVELALCHLAQHEMNTKDIIGEGALWELVRISRDCSRQDIRSLARRTLTSNPAFQTEMRRMRIEC